MLVYDKQLIHLILLMYDEISTRLLQVLIEWGESTTDNSLYTELEQADKYGNQIEFEADIDELMLEITYEIIQQHKILNLTGTG